MLLPSRTRAPELRHGARAPKLRCGDPDATTKIVVQARNRWEFVAQAVQDLPREMGGNHTGGTRICSGGQPLEVSL